ncbi:hypothetical protein LEP1GSC040_1755, partial [Leptospira santarosai str. 2000030832]
MRAGFEPENAVSDRPLNPLLNLLRKNTNTQEFRFHSSKRSPKRFSMIS